jgi:hypothetical protein
MVRRCKWRFFGRLMEFLNVLAQNVEMTVKSAARFCPSGKSPVNPHLKKYSAFQK